MTSRPHTLERASEIRIALEKVVDPMIAEFVEQVGSYPTTLYTNTEAMILIKESVAYIHPYQALEGYQQLTYMTSEGPLDIVLSKKYPNEVGYSALSNNGDEEQLLKITCHNILLRD